MPASKLTIQSLESMAKGDHTERGPTSSRKSPRIEKRWVRAIGIGSADANSPIGRNDLFVCVTRAGIRYCIAHYLLDTASEVRAMLLQNGDLIEVVPFETPALGLYWQRQGKLLFQDEEKIAKRLRSLVHTRGAYLRRRTGHPRHACSGPLLPASPSPNTATLIRVVPFAKESLSSS
jgi:hypothetical protein